MSAFVEYRRPALPRQGLLHRLDLSRELRVELGKLFIFGCERRRLLQELVARFAEVGDLALERFALCSKGFELFSVLLLDRVEAMSEGLGQLASFV
jgi:hypothetical protein